MTRGTYDSLKCRNQAHDSRRAVVEELLKEYKACESPDYISYVCTVSTRVHLAAHLLTTGLWRYRASHVETCMEYSIYIMYIFLLCLGCILLGHIIGINDPEVIDSPPRGTGTVSTFLHHAQASTLALDMNYPRSRDQRPRAEVGLEVFPIL